MLKPLGLKPRSYQLEAARWAFERRCAVVCMPTGTGKTLIAILWIRWLLEKSLARRILVLEPTRFLVEQVARYMREVGGLDARPVHGSLPRGVREEGWAGQVVVATPEIVVSEWSRLVEGGFDALVVDECHHTTGQDAYVRVVKGYDFRYKLGLSAFIPPTRRKMIEETIGEIRVWGWDEPEIKKYTPPWSAEVYEAPLNPAEKKLYEELEALADKLHGHDRALVEMAARWLARDGALGLRESIEKPTRLSKLLEELRDLIYSSDVRPAHKLDALKRVLEDHEGFEKAIVFIDRVVVAKHVASSLSELGVVLVVGRRHGGDPARVLEAAKRPENKLIVSTSAGEEGIDLPSADLLVVWSHTTNTTRMVQRIGRVLRATSEAKTRYRWVVYLVTPDTVDVDNLVDAITGAKKAGLWFNIDPGVVEYLWSLSRRRRLLELIEEKPLDLELIARYMGTSREKAKAMLEWLLERGLTVYIHTAIGRIYAAKTALHKLYKQYREYLNPDKDLEARIQVKLASGREARLKARYATAYAKLSKMLEEGDEITSIKFYTQVEVRKALVRLVMLHYRYRISDKETLRLVLDNAYTAKRIVGEKTLPELSMG